MESGSVRRKLRGTRTSSSDLWTWATLVILLFLSLPKLSQECPSVCECKWKSGKESALCKGKLRAIPNGLDPGTQVLDMSNNMMEKLPNHVFLSLNLLNLQKIFLSECQLVSLEGDTFAKLSNLIELDLSGNRLNSIPTHTFNSIPELRELKVSLNPISRLSNDAFVALPRLVRLELTACRLGTIETWAFRGLPDLKWLHLDNNRLLTVQAESFYPLKSLSGLEVAGNPWNCSCVLQPLREWMGKNNVPSTIPATCSTPKRIEGKSWDRLQLEDFACLPKITSSADQERISRVVEGENGTLLCRLRTTPDTQVRWLSGNKAGAQVGNGSVGTTSGFILTETFAWGPSSETEDGRSGDRSLGIKISKLTVIRTTPREAGLYVCRAETKAGFVVANFTLLVLQTRAEGLTGRLLFTGALVVALLTLIVCLLLLCVVLGSRRVRSSNHILSEAEKIELNHLDHQDHTGKNGGGSVPLMRDENTTPIVTPTHRPVSANHNHHSHNHSDGIGNSSSGLGHGLNNVMMMRKCGGVDRGVSVDRDHTDYKALPTNDPDDDDEEGEVHTEDEGARLRAHESPLFPAKANPNLNTKRSSSPPTPVQSPGQKFRRLKHGVSPQKELWHFQELQERPPPHPRTMTTCPDLLSEKMRGHSDHPSLPRPNRNHEPRPGAYFHRRINSESQSPLLSSGSYGVSMERMGGGGSDSNFLVDSAHSKSSASGCQSSNLRPAAAQQRLSMPTSPLHERDVLSYDYHAAQLAAFLEEYRLLQLELMRMSASLNHLDQPVPPNNNSNSPATSSRQSTEPPTVPPRHFPSTHENSIHHQEPLREPLPISPHLHHRAAFNRSGVGHGHSGLSGVMDHPLNHSSHHHQLKSILKNPSANNNNYMA